MRQYVGASNSERLELLPNVPGLYAWKVNFRRLLGEDATYVHSVLRRVLGHKGTTRTLKSEYFEGSFQDSYRMLESDRLESLVTQVSDDTQFGRDLVSFLEATQRSLYLGKSRELHNRIERHLDEGSPLGSTRAGSPQDGVLMHDDCVLLWVQAGEALPGDLTINCLDTHLQPPTPELEDEEVLAFRLTHFESFAIRAAAPIHNKQLDSND